ncbi:hypothetical protein [Hymenobacter rubripertinctus]|uniref:Lipoprotein n=1 Tax=Hymenobacter rubripertinctus TaxID=2029981 RepID=A0A418QNE6_9BACT|nr:hypothetical protein [Hymenobacter rubripertinctus]RIY06642.1 hypothetical protein D0T11_18400 [Hymenobacter rubripertinctus]
MNKLTLWAFPLLVTACQPSADPNTAHTENLPAAAPLLPAPVTADTPVSALPAGFRAALAAGHLTFQPPAGTLPTPVLKNAQMDYDYAVRMPGQQVEIRYAIRPLNGLPAEDQQGEDEGEVLVDPNMLYSSLLTVVALNISGGQEPATQEFSPETVQQKFGADWGATTKVSAGKEFGPGYAYCLVVALHKHNAADAYCFYLFNEQKDLNLLLDDPAADVFHALRFR